MNYNKYFSIIVLIIIVVASITITEAKASNSTLADTIISIVNNVDWEDPSSFTTTWGIILANKNSSSFEQAIKQNIIRKDYSEALHIARLADLNEYNSTIILENTKFALQNMSMCGSFPINSNANHYGDPDALNEGSFLLYDRFLIWAFQYAQELGLIDKWNKTQAFIDFKDLYDGPPIDSYSGEMLWCDPQEDWAKSYSSRYYDEHAETLSVFLKFYEIGIPEALAYADKAWAGVQRHWNGQYYGYSDSSTVECEMGNFARIIGEYKQEKGGNVSAWERVIQDLNYKLLANGWNSPGWASPGVIVHADSNPQLRLWETLGAIVALHQLFPEFTLDMRTNFIDMLMNQNKAWEGLVGCDLNNGGYFSRVFPGSNPSNVATAGAAAILFLEGIVPNTGSLSIPFREEHFPDDCTPFILSDFNFDYINHKITIPVNAGEFTFIYGSDPVRCTFAETGVYTIEFTSDWNHIKSVNGKNVLPSMPQELDVVEGNVNVSLSWLRPLSDGGAEVTHYRIYKGNTSSELKLFSEVGNVTSFVDIDVVYGESYFYQVSAVNFLGESRKSNLAFLSISGPVTTDDYDGLWHSSDFLISLFAVDSSEIAETYYRVNGDAVQNVSGSGFPEISLESGVNSLEYWSIDGLGFEEIPHKMVSQIKLDKTAPSGSIIINEGALSTNLTSVSLRLTSSDGGSGVYRVRYSNDGIWDTESWVVFEFTKSWWLPLGDGMKTVYYQVKDLAGLISQTYSDLIEYVSIPSVPPVSPEPTIAPSPTPQQSPIISPTPELYPERTFILSIEEYIGILALAIAIIAFFGFKLLRRCD